MLETASDQQIKEILEDAYAFSSSFVKVHPPSDSIDQVMKDVTLMHKIPPVENDDI